MRILFQNEACLVINKLSGESSEFPDIGIVGDGNDYCVPVHRLDSPVSGCLLFAGTPEAAAFLSAAFSQYPPGNGPEQSRIEKRYSAIIEKPPEEFPDEGELVHWLYENKKLNKSFTEPWEEGEARRKRGYAPPQKAILRYRVIGQGERYLFLDVDLVTGRHHQIRAQLAAMGLHIKGDLKYGARRSEKGGGIRLHARSLAFPNPLDPEEIIRVTADPPVMDTLWSAYGEAETAQALSGFEFS